MQTVIASCLQGMPWLEFDTTYVPCDSLASCVASDSKKNEAAFKTNISKHTPVFTQDYLASYRALPIHKPLLLK